MDQSLAAPYLPYLERVLTPSRLQHSFGVMQVMGELAEIYDLNRDTALLAGLLHDAAKDLSIDQQAEIVPAANITFRYPCERNYALYLHGPVGAYLVQKELGITDPVILNAIVRHTWFGDCEEVVTPFDWCLRFADILEPNRRWDERARIIREEEPRLRETVYAGKLEEGAFLQSRMLIRFFEENEMPVHPSYYAADRALSLKNPTLSKS